MIFDDTIAAISTAPGTGAIAIVRLSGPDAWTIARKIFAREPEGESSEWKSHLAMHGYISDPGSKSVVDEVVLIPYKGPNSFTGEDLVEINCHGGPIVTRALLNLCLHMGARLAEKGEFTKRAFLGGRIDLTQAEAVLDVIQAKTERQSRLALSALTGHLGERIKEVRATLVALLSGVVAGIDFPEEVGELPDSDLKPKIRECINKLIDLEKTSRSGRFLREGLRLAIVGKPNVGKSSLLNQLVKFERAIVTDIPGTTRDSLEENLDINGIPVILTDTAGVRHTDDTVEKIGIDRTQKAIDSSDLILLVTDAAGGTDSEDGLIKNLIGEKACFALANKIDLNPSYKMGTNGFLQEIAISAKTGTGIEELCSSIENFALKDSLMREAGGSLNQRQGQLCLKALNALKLVEEAVASGLPQDCLATDLKTAVDSLSEICGEAVSEEIITDVFARFCIGK